MPDKDFQACKGEPDAIREYMARKCGLMKEVLRGRFMYIRQDAFTRSHVFYIDEAIAGSGVINDTPPPRYLSVLDVPEPRGEHRSPAPAKSPLVERHRKIVLDD